MTWKVTKIFIATILLFAAFAIVGGLWLFRDLPSLDNLHGNLAIPSVRITDRNGKLLYEALGELGGRHAVVSLENIPIQLRQATIATEDSSFYRNPGVDLRGVLRAVWINLRGGETLAGGSTITQQVVRNLILSSGERGERSLRRKLREIYLAWQLTRVYSKDEILALYLNQTYYGGMAYGVEAAAQTYFAKPVNHLDLAESTLLAGLPQAPAFYNPYTDMEAAKVRQSIVLERMVSEGYITAEQKVSSEREKIILAEEPYPIKAPHFVMMVRNQLDDIFPLDSIDSNGGLIVQTTLDLDWQEQAERSIVESLEDLQRSDDGLGHNVKNAALVALNPENGDILSLVGSPDYFDSANAGAVNMAIAPRQPGSALKPLVYAAALTPNIPSGGWTAATMILDVKTSFRTRKGSAYTPTNYDRREHGPVLVREALASSLNIPAVKTLEHVGLENLFQLASRMGVTTSGDPADYDLSLALGGGAVRLIDLSAAYGVFANGGSRVEPRMILEVLDFQGNTLFRANPSQQVRVLDERVAWLISDILSDNDARRLGFGENSVLKIDRLAAVKTGTTSNFHDNWTVGYTPDLVVGVWSGNSDYEPMRDVNGLTGAAPIWHQFMRSVMNGYPIRSFVRPPGLEKVEVCALSGLLPGNDCPMHKQEWFISGTSPLQIDPFYKKVNIDSRSGAIADGNTPQEYIQGKMAIDLPSQAWQWAKEQGLLLYTDLISDASMSETSFSISGSSENLPTLQSSLELISPQNGSLFRLSSKVSADSQRILLQANNPPEANKIRFIVDGTEVGLVQSPPFQAWWVLKPGEHRAWVETQYSNGQITTSPIIQFTVVQ